MDGGLIVCEEMVKKDVMTPLVALFHQVTHSLTSICLELRKAKILCYS